jgi:hypothetical protein
MLYLWRYAENCEEPISRIGGLMVLMGRSIYRKPFLVTVIRALRHMFS